MKNNTVLVFPGQGSQFVGMGKDIYENFSVAKEVFKKTDEVVGYNLSKIIFEGSQEELTKTQNTQPALMVVSAAIIEVLEKEFGKKVNELCSYVAGHSLGEYSALYASKSLTLEDSVQLLQVRGSSMANCGALIEGAMAAVIGAEEAVINEIVNDASAHGICQIANDNSVGQIVISGEKNAILKAIEIGKAKGVRRIIELPVSGAFHSSLMLEAKEIMKDTLLNIKISKPVVPVIANISAKPTSDIEEIRENLVNQITGSVRWRETMLFVERNNINNLIEVGAGKVLCGLATRTCKDIKVSSIQTHQDILNFVNNN